MKAEHAIAHVTIADLPEVKAAVATLRDRLVAVQDLANAIRLGEHSADQVDVADALDRILGNTATARAAEARAKFEAVHALPTRLSWSDIHPLLDELLGDGAYGVTSVTIGVRNVKVERLVKEPNGDCHVDAASRLLRSVVEIPIDPDPVGQALLRANIYGLDNITITRSIRNTLKAAQDGLTRTADAAFIDLGITDYDQLVTDLHATSQRLDRDLYTELAQRLFGTDAARLAEVVAHPIEDADGKAPACEVCAC